MTDLYTIADRVKKNKTLRVSLISTLIIGMLAHGYSYFNSTFGMDRFYWFGGNSNGYNHKLNMGKWFFRAVKELDWGAYLPWLNGCITLVCMALSVWMICETLKIRSDFGIILTAGVCVVDGAVLMAHFYDPDSFMEALLLGCISLPVWGRQDIRRWIRVVIGAVFISLSLGVYGAYTTVPPTVVIFCCIFALIEGEPVKKVFFRGIEYLITFVTGVGLYYLIQRLLMRLTHTELISYMGEDRLVTGASASELVSFVKRAYLSSLRWWTGSSHIAGYRVATGWIAIILFVCMIICLLLLTVHNEHMAADKRSYLLLAFLILVLPLSAGAIFVMAFGVVHGLMTFTYAVFYIGLVRIAELAYDRGFTDFRKHAVTLVYAVTCLGVVLFIGRGILVSNMSYARWDNLNEISESIGFRVLDRIESCEGFTGHEKVYFVGDVTESPYFGKSRFEGTGILDELDGVMGVSEGYANIFLYYSHLIMYLQEYTETDLDMDYYSYESGVFDEAQTSHIHDMPLFPADGSVEKIDDSVIVKFAEVPDGR